MSQAAERLSPLRLLQVTATVSTLDRFAMPPMLMAIATSLDVPLTQVVTAAGAYFLVYGLSQPLWGFASDRYGRVGTLRASLVIAGVLSLVSALSPTVLALGILRGLAGGFFGAAYPSALIYLGDTVAPARRQQAITGLMMGVALGTAGASAGAGLLADVVSWRVPFLLTGSAALLLAVLLSRLPEPAGHRATARTSLSAIGRSRVTLLVLLFAFLEGVVLLGALTLLPTAVEGTGASSTVAGVVTGVYGIAVLVGSSSVGRLSLAWHPARLILLGAGCAALGTGLLTVTRRPAVAVAVAVLLGIAWLAMHSSLQTWATEVLPAARAVVVSLFAGSLFVGSAVGAIAVGGLADSGRFAVVYGGYTALAVPLGLGAWMARKRWRRPVGEVGP